MAFPINNNVLINNPTLNNTMINNTSLHNTTTNKTFILYSSINNVTSGNIHM